MSGAVNLFLLIKQLIKKLKTGDARDKTRQEHDSLGLKISFYGRTKVESFKLHLICDREIVNCVY